jgi:hypothetical protein
MILSKHTHKQNFLALGEDHVQFFGKNLCLNISISLHVDGLNGKHFILKMLTYHYNLMTDSGADPEEVVSNPNFM